MNTTVNYNASVAFINLEWIPEPGVLYSVNVSPIVDITFITRSRIEVEVDYNTQYSLSVTAKACKQPFSETITQNLTYGEFVHDHSSIMLLHAAKL